ncbi:thioredoxin-dependent thiol peroxidase [Heliobacterium gestii]|uniref:thioredoxin-dependent peroxiredoxin n=1 Tax=Heliomicrobium gestii TaxID=2699 RepID=A0A845LEL2_HELGE|nr:thioredoxin-dependent thiol peroxidase [Heliomicrobium gestii]MBM7867607.1 peroxiredoxin Q/BCP [Heliomicrobium gestii]MZP44001.1 thioredoxin-dependent thiol peroxidase [Heliomicrobium gestii]
MEELTIGQKAPDFELPASNGETVRLSQFLGRPVALYFYPKDNTAGCTLEAQEFRDLHSQFEAANAVILGVSRDSVKSHERFAEKQCLPFLLLSDSDSTLCNAYQVLKEKTLYGKKSIGIERSTFLIDPQGNIQQIYRKVKSAGHAAAVLQALQPR